MSCMTDTWLARTAVNRILGPFTRSEVEVKIRSGELKPQDEICQSSGSWFCLREQEELSAQLGIMLPRPARSSDEEATDTEMTQPEFQDLIMPNELAQSNLEQTAVLSLKKNHPSPVTPVSAGSSHLSFMKGATWLLVSIAALLLITILRLSRTF